MTLKARYLAEAEAEVLRYYDRYFDEGGFDVAERFYTAVTQTEWLLLEAPNRWAIYLYGTRRVLLPQRWPYALVYITEPELLVVAFIHLHRDDGYWRRRLKEPVPG